MIINNELSCFLQNKKLEKLLILLSYMTIKFNEKIQIYAAFFGALFFSLCPLRVESVSWISERKDVLCAFFYCSSLLAYLSFADKKQYSYKDSSKNAFFQSKRGKSPVFQLPPERKKTENTFFWKNGTKHLIFQKSRIN